MLALLASVHVCKPQPAMARRSVVDDVPVQLLGTPCRAGCRLAAEAAVQAWPEHCADVMSAKSAAQDAAAAAAEVQEAGQEAHDAGQTAGGAGGAMDTAGVPAAQFEALPATSCMSL